MIAFEPTEEQQMIRDTVREFAQNELREISRSCDEQSQIPDDVLQKTWELGLVASAIPESMGGGGMEHSAVTNALVLEELAWGCASIGLTAVAPSGFILPVLEFGTPEQQAQYLAPFTGAEFCAGALALSEPRFAFDAQNLRTTAEPKGSSFVISGTKRFVPLGDRAQWFLVVARSGSGESSQIDAFVVPRDASGLTIVAEPEKTLGLRSAPLSQLELARVEVPASQRLGGGAGLPAERLINRCRVANLASAVGIARAMLELAIPYAKEREAFGQPIAQKQAIAFMLAEMRIELDAMRLLVWKAASAFDHGENAARETALAETYVRREAMKIADNGLQVFGGHGYIRDYPVEMWYRNMRTVTAIDAMAAV